MKYRLLKNILDFKAGTIHKVKDGNLRLGVLEWNGWEIPLFIVESHPETFELLPQDIV